MLLLEPHDKVHCCLVFLFVNKGQSISQHDSTSYYLLGRVNDKEVERCPVCIIWHIMITLVCVSTCNNRPANKLLLFALWYKYTYPLRHPVRYRTQ